MAGQTGSGDIRPRRGPRTKAGQTEVVQDRGGSQQQSVIDTRTPLFRAQHSERYARQAVIAEYEEATAASLIVVIDQIFPTGVTYVEELLGDCDSSRPLHVLLASPGGDGETAIRLVRGMQSRCSRLTFVVPDMAKSAATLMCLGAHEILMGPTGDLGPVDPQFQIGGRSLASAKEIVAAVDEAEDRIKKAPDTFPLFASLLADVNMLLVEQARSALDRTGALVKEALACCGGRSQEEVDKLAGALHAPLIDEPTSHSAVLNSIDAARLGLPAVAADPDSLTWKLLWSLWTRYFVMGCWPNGSTAIYEGRRASHVVTQ